MKQAFNGREFADNCADAMSLSRHDQAQWMQA